MMLCHGYDCLIEMKIAYNKDFSTKFKMISNIDKILEQNVSEPLQSTLLPTIYEQTKTKCKIYSLPKTNNLVHIKQVTSRHVKQME
jgi:hypothetical protein